MKTNMRSMMLICFGLSILTTIAAGNEFESPDALYLPETNFQVNENRNEIREKRSGSCNYFQPQVTLGVGSYVGIRSVAAADVNCDGKLDLIASHYLNDTIGVFLNQGGGNFANQVIYPLTPGAGPFSVIAADVNGDKKLDLITGNYWTSDINVFINTGSGTFNPYVAYNTTNLSGAYYLTAADFNKDKAIDIVVVNGYIATISVFINKGDGTFFPEAIYPTGGFPTAAEAADVNGDKKPDIVVMNNLAFNVAVFINTGNGTFYPQVTYPSNPGGTPRWASLVDVNDDKKIDIVVANGLGDTFGVLTNQGTSAGTFNSEVTYSTGNNSNPRAIATANLNNDKYPDVVVANFAAATIAVFINSGTGTFSQQASFSTGTGSGPRSLILADLNGDKALDAIVGNFDSNNIGIFYGCPGINNSRRRNNCRGANNNHDDSSDSDSSDDNYY